MKKTVIVVILLLILFYVFYDTIVLSIEEFIMRHKNAFWAPAALYKLAGLSMFILKYDIALSSYSKAVDTFPLYSLSDESLYKIALIYEKQQRWKDAVSCYKRFMAKYPKHKWAPEADEKIEKIEGLYLK
ncbi:tetratricopeptide repeat protein [bacterium]|jgi:outer membrane protein assembly factor BamD (BamD/ComL family)|nr:tetratricopeptide repeat protein [bacterium]